jgi:hypothetical protein
MTTFPGSPRLIRGGLVLVDPESGHVRRVIALQYNPDTLSRTLQPQTVSDDGHDRSQALRLKGPPIETISTVSQLGVPATNIGAIVVTRRSEMMRGFVSERRSLASERCR